MLAITTYGTEIELKLITSCRQTNGCFLHAKYFRYIVYISKEYNGGGSDSVMAGGVTV